jgi:type VI secretion system protein ImpH
MGTNIGQQKIDIKKELLEHGSRFSFVQAIRLLRLIFKDIDKEIEQKLRFRPRLSLDFPKSDIEKIEKKDEFIRITVTFLGLYGESSPLPTFYTEILLEESLNDKSAMRDFIDIFNMPVYQLYFKVWLKNRLGIRINEYHDERALNFLHIFSGLPTKNIRDKFDFHHLMLKYNGLNMRYVKSAESLRALVSDFTNNHDVQIQQCIEQKVSIPNNQRCLLGVKNTTLDDNLHVGSKIKDRMGKFRIIIKNLSISKFNALLPDTNEFKSLVKVITLFLNNALNWDIALELKKNENKTVMLGDSNFSRLGMNTWLGNDHENKKILILKGR